MKDVTNQLKAGVESPGSALPHSAELAAPAGPVGPARHRNPAAEHVVAMELLLGVVQELSLARDLQRIMDVVRHAARELTGADGATFVLREGDFCYYADEDAIAPLWKGKRFPLSTCVSGWVMLNREAAIIPDIYTDARIPTDAYRPTFVKSLAMVPIRSNQPVGAIGAYWAVRRQPTAPEVALLQALANSTSVAMENVQLLANLERKVAERTAHLKLINEELECFSHSVSHDLRAPLRHMIGFAGLLREEAGAQLNADGRRYLDIINDAARRMEVLIEDLLEFSRMGRAALQRQKVAMSDLVAEVIAGLQCEVRTRAIEWELAPLPEVTGDRAMLKQVWANLLSNAVKFTAMRPQARIQVSAAEHPGEYEFAVCDNGAGFDMAYAGKLFTPFQRLHRREEFPGSGIGLANAGRILGRHGGRIWAQAELDHGATFRFTLPRNGAIPA